MKFLLNFLVTFLLLILFDFTLIRHQSAALNADCILIQSRISENSTHPFHDLLQPTSQLKAGNFVSLVSENTLGNALRSCYFSTSTVAFIVFVSFENELMGVIEKISEDVRQFRRAKRESNCKMFLFSVFQTNTSSNAFPNDLFAGLPSPFPFDISSDFYLLFGEKDSTIQQLRILELYTVKNRLFVQSIENQYQSNNDPLDFIHNFLFHMKPIKTLRRQNLQGVSVVAASYLNKEDENDDMYEIRIGKDVNGEDYYESGLSVSILRDIRTAVNFTEKMLKVYINGDNYFESSFTSEQVQFDINLYHLGITKNRTKVAQPLLPTFFDGVHAIFSQPSDKSSRNIYGKPFTFEMWLTLLSAWTLIFLCCNLFLYLHSRNIIQSSSTTCTSQVKHVEVESEKSVETVVSQEVVHPYIPFETMLWCIGTICQQGWYTLPKPTPIRLILITGLFLSVTCIAAFIGKLTSELYDVSKPIKSLKDLLEYTEKIYLIASSDTSFDILEGLSSSDPNLLQKIKFASSDTIQSKLVDRPGHACVITWTDVLDGYIRESYTKGSKAKEDVAKSQADAYICTTFSSFSFQATSSLYVPKDSELEQLFNYRIIVGRERGFNRRYWNTYNSETKLSCLKSSPQLTNLGLDDVFFAFLIIFTGMLTSGGIMIAESTFHRLGAGSKL